MKITLRQPLCISRMKKKSLNPNTLLKENQSLDMSALHICDLSTDNNFSKQLCTSKQLKEVSGIKNLQNKENQINQEKIEPKHDEFKALRKRIQSLEKQNKQLTNHNEQLQSQVAHQQEQKIILTQRIDKFAQQLEKLKKDYDQYESTNTRKPNSNCLQPKLITIKQKSQQKRDQKQPYQQKRMSLHESVCDLSTKVKEYKNQLEVQKIRRVNLERELERCKETMKVEARLEIESVTKKVETLKQVLERKNKQIEQKQSLIRRILGH